MALHISSILNLLFTNPQYPFKKVDGLEVSYETLQPDVDGQSVAVQRLREDTTPEILQKVKDYIAGVIGLDQIDMTPENALSYLAAAKIVDLTHPYDAQEERSTLAIRELCMQQGPNPQTKERISMLNALTIPSPDETNLDLLNRGVRVRNPDNLFVLRDGTRDKAYFHPKVIEKINRVFEKSLQGVLLSTRYLEGVGKNVWFNGCYGAGKTHHIKEVVRGFDADLPISSIVYGTDSFKTHLVQEFPQSDDSGAFILALALRKEFEKVLKTQYVGARFLQEGVLSKEADVNDLFAETKNIQFYDFDAPFRELCLRVLGRPTKFNFDVLKGNVTNTRTTRDLILQSLRQDDDGYELNYAGEKLSKEQARLKNTELKEERFDEIGNSPITAEEAKRLPENMQKYVGWTIRDALNDATKPK